MSNPLKTYLVNGGIISAEDYARAEAVAAKEQCTLSEAIANCQTAAASAKERVTQ